MISIRSLLPLPRLLQLSCIAALASGCFQDVEGPGMTQPTCEAGTLGCECSNGLCGDELTCSPTANKCMPDDCDPGTLFCECAAGGCDATLECVLGLCSPEMGGSGPDPSTTTTGGPTSMTDPTTLTSSSTMTSAMTMTASMTDSTTSSTTEVDTTATETTDDSSTSTGELLDCIEENPKSCEDCFECVGGPGQSCKALDDTCGETSGCGEVSACLSACGAGGLCFDDCCDGHPQPAVDAALELFQCHKDSCGSSYCPRFEVPVCTGG